MREELLAVEEVVARRRRPRPGAARGSCRSRRSGSLALVAAAGASASMIVSLPTPDGPEMITSSAPGAPVDRHPASGRGRRIAAAVSDAGLGRRRHRPPPAAVGGRRPASGADSRTSSSSAGSGAVGPDQLRRPTATASSSRQAWRNSRSRPSGPRARRAGAVDRVAGDGVADRIEVDPDLVRPAGHEVELEERPAGEALADAVAGDRRRARRARPPSGSGASGRARSAPRSARPPRPRCPWTSARYVFLTRRALSWAISDAWAASFLATISRPLVSRSRRWTIPGRRTPAMPPYSRAPAGRAAR